MSLLIKALEQAAKDRKAGRSDAQPAAPSADAPLEPTLEPPPPPRPGARAAASEPAAASASPALALDTGAPPPRRAPSSLSDLAAIDAQQQRARAATVMQASGGRSAEIVAFLRGNPVVLLGGLAVLFGIGFGIYVYLQIAQPGVFVRQAATKAQPAPQPPPPPPAPQGLPDTPAPAGVAGLPPFDPVPAPSGPQAAVGPAASFGAIGAPPAPQAGAPAAAAPSSQFPVTASSVIGARQAMEAPRALPADRAPEPRRETGSISPREPERSPPAARVSSAPAAAAAPAPAAEARERIAVSPTAAQPRLNPTVSEAYTLLQSGDIEEARALYGKAVQAEPLNIDALLGLAYIAAKENRSDDATRLYVRILQLNPRHAVAQAALIGLMGRADPAASESRLKQLIAREPSPFLHFVLGNLYADQAQWPQAQQSYYQAHHLEPDNPDYAYNLAIGLDHLRQGKLALNYYRRADQLASAHGGSNFNLTHARERIRILSSQVE